MYVRSQIREAALENLSSDPVTGLAAGRVYYNTTTGKFRLYNGTAWEDVGSGGFAGVNYINNGSFEASTDGWATYADAAGTSPVDGTGGTANITLTRVTSSPLRGSAMGRITKDAANRQGEGISYNFTVKEADKSSLMRVEFVYKASAAFDYGDALNGADPSDVTVWVYDRDGSALYGVAPNTLNGSGKFVGYFQTNTNDDYRLILHISGTNSSAWTLDIDDISFSPSEAVYGPNIQNTVAYTPTITTVSGTLTNGTPTGSVTYVGDLAFLNGDILFSGASGTYGQIRISLPFTVDTTKFIGGSVPMVGTVEFYDASTTFYHGILKLVNSTTMEIAWATVATHTGTVPVGSNYPSGTMPVSATVVSGDRITWRTFGIPVQGRGSNVVVNNGDGRAVVVNVYGQPNSTIDNAQYRTVTWSSSTEVVDNFSAFNPATGEFTVPVSGYYRVAGQTSVSGTESLDQFLGTLVALDGVTVGPIAVGRVWAASVTNTYCPFSFPEFFANAGQKITIQARTSIGSPAWNSNTTENFLGISMVPVAGTLGAGSRVFLWANTSTTTVGTTDTDIVFTNTVENTAGSSAWNGTTFTVPVAGEYEISGAILDSSATTGAAGQNVQLKAFKNGSAVGIMNLFYAQAGVTTAIGVAGAMSVGWCNPGDTIKLSSIKTASVGTLTLSGSSVENWVQIRKVN